MADTIRMFFLLLSASTALTFTLRAVRHWKGERAGRVYELPVDRRGIALRAGAAGIAAVVAATLAVPLLHRSPAPAVSASSLAAPRPTSGTRATPQAAPVPPPPPRTPEPAPPQPSPSPPPSAEARTLGHPSGGTLDLLGDGTRVWLPPFYDTPRAAGVAYPVVLAHVDGPQGDPDLYAGLEAGLLRGRSDPFVLVMPDNCDRDSADVLAEVAHRYRTLTSVTARAVLGVGRQAPCAVREALANPGRYRAGIGISGAYPPLTATPGPQPSLLLASAGGENGSHASALRLRTTLHARGDAVRLIDGVGKRSELMGLVAAYLTEKLDGAARGAGGAASAHAAAHVPAPVRSRPHDNAPAHVRTHVPAPTPAPARKPVGTHVRAHVPAHVPGHARAHVPAPVRSRAASHTPAPERTAKGHA